MGTSAARPATRLAPVRVKKSRRRGAARRVPPAPAREGHAQVEPARRGDGSGERCGRVQKRRQPAPHEDAGALDARACVERADGQRGGRAAGAGDVAVPRRRSPVVPGRRDDERVERERSGDGAALRAVGEAGERLGERDERDSRSVVCVAVAVGVDRAVEPGDDLVAARVDRPVAEPVGLPACDADRAARPHRWQPPRA